MKAVPLGTSNTYAVYCLPQPLISKRHLRIQQMSLSRSLQLLTKARVPCARAFASSTLTPINTEKAPAAVGPYSQAVAANGFIYVSGQLPLDTATKKFVSDTDVSLQAKKCLENMSEILKAANSDMSKVVKTTILLADIADFPKVNAVYAEFFKAPYPARATFAVKALPLGALVEIEAVAVPK